jgi:hypothetical protein
MASNLLDPCAEVVGAGVCASTSTDVVNNDNKNTNAGKTARIEDRRAAGAVRRALLGCGIVGAFV